MRFCAEPFCSVVVQRGRCPTHDRSNQQTRHQQLAQNRGTTAERGYGSRWQRRAALFKARYSLCGMRPGGQRPVMSRCFDEGIVTAAEQVDHVVPHKGDQGLLWDELGNWQALCGRCGAAKSAAGL